MDKPTEDDVAWLLAFSCSGARSMSAFAGPIESQQWSDAVDRLTRLCDYTRAQGVELAANSRAVIKADTICRWLLNNREHITLTGNTTLHPHLK